MPTQVRKRDGRIVKFEADRIKEAISKADESIGNKEPSVAEEISNKILEDLNKKGEKYIPSVEEIQDLIEKTLMDAGKTELAKSFILYRQKRKELRDAKALLGVKDDIKLSVNAIKVLQSRFLKKIDGKTETPGELFRRVAKSVASIDKNYEKTKEQINETEEEFYNMMINLEFLPNSTALMNIGREFQQLSASFVLPVEDSLDKIFSTLSTASMIHQSGGGVGFSFSSIRPKGDLITSTGGSASGPVSFMKVFNTTTEAIKSGAIRRGANMGVLRVDHPDIIEFIIIKEKENIENFNLSVGLTDKFMKALEKDSDYSLINPRTKQVVNKLSASRVFDLIVTMAWKSGDPGVLFLDRINNSNSNFLEEEIESTDPCGESPMYPNESCVLGSINLAKMIKDGKPDFEKLKLVSKKAVHFLDNIIDLNKYPTKEVEKISKDNRRIGVGVMGFADMLIELGIPYDSEDAINLVDGIMHLVNQETKNASEELAKDRGPFPNFKKSVWSKKYKKLRNATTTAIAPTGTISMIANCSSGIEPLYAICYIRSILDNTEVLETNPMFEKIAREKGFYNEVLMRQIAVRGSIQEMNEIPKEIKKIFVTAHDIPPQYHVKIQANFQKHTDGGVSKTVNVPNNSSVEDIEDIYLLAYKLGCKGITIYRDRSKSEQALNIEALTTKPKKERKDLLETAREVCKSCS